MLETLTIETFTPLVGDEFRLEQITPDRQLRLSAVNALGGGGPHDPQAATRRTPFSLLFHGQRDEVLPQRIYRLGHPTLGAIDLFIVPLGPDAQGMRYEAIFT